MSPVDEYRVALSAAVTALHWVARSWEKSAPGVARKLRELADRLSDKERRLKEAEMELMYQEGLWDDPLDPPKEPPTDKITQSYGEPPPDDSKK